MTTQVKTMEQLILNNTGRILVHFSCGAASAVAAKIALNRFQEYEIEIIYCDTSEYEHPDNKRFMEDVSKWIGREVKILTHHKYKNIMDVFRGERYIVGPYGAPCTRLLKRGVGKAYASPHDIHVFGLTVDEGTRIKRFEKNNTEAYIEWVLKDAGITKKDCYKILQDAGIRLPAMYSLGYNNNNCIGCVKGGMGYWNKIRKDFPDRFNEMAILEREIGASILTDKNGEVFLDELDPKRGRFIDEDIECGVLCPGEKENNI